MNAPAALLKASDRLPSEPYAVDRPGDARGQYQLELAAEFPFGIKRLRFAAGQRPPLTWHTYLELFVMLSRECRVQMGGTIVTLRRGDVLVMDHLKLHAVLDFPGRQAEAIVIRFLPEMVRGLGSAPSDHLLLLPFYCQIEEQPHVLRAADAAAGAVHLALAEVFAAYTAAGPAAYTQTGARAYFLVALHHLARHFAAVERLEGEFERQQTKTRRLRKLFEYVSHNYASRISLPQAAAIAGLSKPQFHAVFKKTTGMTLVEYLTQVRLAQAVRLLRETDESVVSIANHVGFSDQSYFDRRFRQRFGRTPLQFRKARGQA